MKPGPNQIIHAQAERRAAQVIDDYAITALPVDPFAIASSAGIHVMVDESPGSGISGCLIKQGDTFGIMVFSKGLNNTGYTKFTLSHELGHYFLDGHMDVLFPDGDGQHQSRAGFVAAEPHEREADHFAASLLMPKRLVMPVLRSASPGLRAVQRIADRCEASRTAAAIRYAALTEHAVAIIVSSEGTVDYCFCSDAFRDLHGFRPLARGSLVPRSSMTAEVGAAEKSGTVEPDLWFDGLRAPDGYEEAVHLGRYGHTLTVISIDDDEQGEDEDEDHDY